MLKELLRPEIEDIIKQRRWKDLRIGLEGWEPAEIAELLLEIEKEYKVLLFRALPREVSTQVFSHIDSEERDQLLNELTDGETRRLLADMSPDDRTALLEELPAKVTKSLMNMLSAEDLKEARYLLGYPEESIGRLMTPDFVTVQPDYTIRQAIEHIRKFGKDSETIYRVYVIDDNGRLIDDILLKNLILAEEEMKISELMDDTYLSLSAFDDREEAVRMLEKYDVLALPVVDSNGYIVGIVTFDDIYDVSEEETTEDFQRTSGINPLDQSYLSASIWKLYGKRVPWLLAMVFANFITASVISHYDYVTVAFVSLVAFIPLLTGTGGNSGTQSATLIIRGIATDDIRYNDWLRVFRKEMVVGLLLGVSLAIVAFIRGYLESDHALQLAWVISTSLIILILWSNVIGSLLPILLHKMKLDPAVISGPVITTIVDVSGLLIYFNIAIYMMD
ncbi:MAG: magnesium transporter [Ignavibacteriae bacterium HGW-Ignavibacteriae-4]|jgi:magnesium transporter|nr:MAG: magnesium transporter [Ignavibacteriae bacterium HGW-Ignavibacteriae-4]